MVVVFPKELTQHIQHPVGAPWACEVERAVQSRLRVELPYDREGVVRSDAVGMLDHPAAAWADAEVLWPSARRGAERQALKVPVGRLVKGGAACASCPGAQNRGPRPGRAARWHLLRREAGQPARTEL